MGLFLSLSCFTLVAFPSTLPSAAVGAAEVISWVGTKHRAPGTGHWAKDQAPQGKEQLAVTGGSTGA